MNSEFPIGPEKITHGNEYLNFEFRRVPKMNSEYPIVPEKSMSSPASSEYLKLEFRRLLKMNSEFPDVPEKTTRKPRENHEKTVRKLGEN